MSTHNSFSLYMFIPQFYYPSNQKEMSRFQQIAVLVAFLGRQLVAFLDAPMLLCQSINFVSEMLLGSWGRYITTTLLRIIVKLVTSL